MARLFLVGLFDADEMDPMKPTYKGKAYIHSTYSWNPEMQKVWDDAFAATWSRCKIGVYILRDRDAEKMSKREIEDAVADTSDPDLVMFKYGCKNKFWADFSET
jgi:hypothetical protein